MSRPPRRTSRIITAAAVAALGLIAAYLYIDIKASRIVSETLTSALGQPVSVSGVGVGLATGLTLYGLRIKNPPGHTRPDLLRVRSISVMPDPKELIRGRLVFYYVHVGSPELFLERSKGGAWNLDPLLEHFRKSKPRKFTIARLKVVRGSLLLPGRGLDLKLKEAEVTGLSSLKPGPAGFSFSLTDGKGAALTGEGRADIYGRPMSAAAKLSLTAPLKGYADAVRGIGLGDAALSVAVDLRYADGTLGVRLDGSTTGARSPYIKGRRLDARFGARAVYQSGKDAVSLQEAHLDLPGITTATATGRVTSIRTGPSLDFTANVPPFPLTALGPYLPVALKLTGRVVPETITVRGSLSPAAVTTSAGFMLDGAGVTYKGAGVGGIHGKLGLSAGGDGALSIRMGLHAPGEASLTGNASYKGGAGRFDIKALGFDLSHMDGAPAGAKGVVNASASGTFTQRQASARYAVNGIGIKLARPAADIARADITGEASVRDGRLKVSGALDASGAGGGLIAAGYSYSDRALLIRKITFSQKDLSLTADGLDVKLKGGRTTAALFGGAASFGGDFYARGIKAVAVAVEAPGKGVSDAACSFDFAEASAFGLPVRMDGKVTYKDTKAGLGAQGEVGGNPFSLYFAAEIRSNSLKKPFLSGKLNINDASSVKRVMEKEGLPVGLSGGRVDISVLANGDDLDSLKGSATFRVDGLGLDYKDKPLLTGIRTELRPAYEHDVVTLPDTVISAGGVKASVSGRMSREAAGWSARARFELAETGLAALQESVIESLPARFKWADTGGSLSGYAALALHAGGPGELTGELRLKGVTLDLPDEQISIGPADGTVPLRYTFGAHAALARPAMFRNEGFEKAEYGTLLAKYSKRPRTPELSIKKIAFGFVEADDIEVGVASGAGYYQLDWFSASGFGGRVYGYGTADFTGGQTRYGLSVIVNDFSLAGLCRRVPAINGYISGKVDGLARLMISGTGMSGVAGAGMFWAKEAPDEDREISKAFLKRLMGATMKKYMLIGDRSYDTGELDVIFYGGDLVFDKLLISNRNFLGYQDLLVTVAPVSNRISIEHLLEVIKDVSSRAGGGPAATR
jgi:hypothetical protein